MYHDPQRSFAIVGREKVSAMSVTKEASAAMEARRLEQEVEERERLFRVAAREELAGKRSSEVDVGKGVGAERDEEVIAVELRERT